MHSLRKKPLHIGRLSIKNHPDVTRLFSQATKSTTSREHEQVTSYSLDSIYVYTLINIEGSKYLQTAVYYRLYIIYPPGGPYREKTVPEILITRPRPQAKVRIQDREHSFSLIPTDQSR